MSRRRLQVFLLVVAGAAVALLISAAGAQASGILGSGVGPNIGPNLNPLPSVGEILDSVVNGLFGALLSALTPSFLKHADIAALEWLVALPNVADTTVWPTVGRLEGSMMWVAGALLPTTLIIATARDTALSLSFRASPGNALLRVIGAVFWLVMYRFSFRFGVAFVNTLTHTMLSWPIVSEGLDRTVLVMFAGSAVFGVGGAFLGLLGLVALVFAICLFALKVLILSVLAILFVAGPLFIALTPLPTLGYLARGWLLAVVGVCLIPVGWCIVFSTAGAISLDVTNLGGGAHIGSRVVGAFAALVTFYIAFRWPLMVLGHVRNAFGGLGVRTGSVSGGGGAGVSNGALAAKAQRARTKLQATMLAAGRGVGLAAGQLGAPRGGLAGVAGRGARPHVAAAAASGAIAVGPPRPRPRPRPTATGERIAAAGDKLRETPGRMREAWRSAGDPASPSGRASAPDAPQGSRHGAGAGSRQATQGSGRAPRGSSRSGRSGAASARPTNAARGSRKRSGASQRAPVVPPAPSAQAPQPSPRGAGQAGAGAEATRQASAPAHPRSGADPRTQADQRPRPAPNAQRQARTQGQDRQQRAPRTPSQSRSRPRKRRKP
jgi:hypothetical protein